jgi:hypothetical protein
MTLKQNDLGCLAKASYLIGGRVGGRAGWDAAGLPAATPA